MSETGKEQPHAGAPVTGNQHIVLNELLCNDNLVALEHRPADIAAGTEVDDPADLSGLHQFGKSVDFPVRS